MSWSLMIYSVGFIIYGIMLFIMAAAGAMTWLHSMYGLALIKMVTMPMKYMPQVRGSFTLNDCICDCDNGIKFPFYVFRLI